jgi:hypothetical protein
MANDFGRVYGALEVSKPDWCEVVVVGESMGLYCLPQQRQICQIWVEDDELVYRLVHHRFAYEKQRWKSYYTESPRMFWAMLVREQQIDYMGQGPPWE